MVRKDGTGVEIPDPDGIIIVIIGDVGGVGLGRGVDDGPLAIMAFQAV